MSNNIYYNINIKDDLSLFINEIIEEFNKIDKEFDSKIELLIKEKKNKKDIIINNYSQKYFDYFNKISK